MSFQSIDEERARRIRLHIDALRSEVFDSQDDYELQRIGEKLIGKQSLIKEFSGKA